MAHAGSGASGGLNFTSAVLTLSEVIGPFFTAVSGLQFGYANALLVGQVTAPVVSNVAASAASAAAAASSAAPSLSVSTTAQTAKQRAELFKSGFWGEVSAPLKTFVDCERMYYEMSYLGFRRGTRDDAIRVMFAGVPTALRKITTAIDKLIRPAVAPAAASLTGSGSGTASVPASPYRGASSGLTASTPAPSTTSSASLASALDAASVTALQSLSACLTQAAGIVSHRAAVVTLLQSLLEPKLALDFEALLRSVDQLYARFNPLAQHSSALPPANAPFATAPSGPALSSAVSLASGSTNTTASGANTTVAAATAAASAAAAAAADSAPVAVNHPALRVLRDNLLTETKALARLFQIQLLITGYRYREALMAITLCRFELSAWSSALHKRARKLAASAFAGVTNSGAGGSGSADPQSPAPPFALWCGYACSSLLSKASFYFFGVLKERCDELKEDIHARMDKLDTNFYSLLERLYRRSAANAVVILVDGSAQPVGSTAPPQSASLAVGAGPLPSAGEFSAAVAVPTGSAAPNALVFPNRGYECVCELDESSAAGNGFDDDEFAFGGGGSGAFGAAAAVPGSVPVGSVDSKSMLLPAASTPPTSAPGSVTLGTSASSGPLTVPGASSSSSAIAPRPGVAGLAPPSLGASSTGAVGGGAKSPPPPVGSPQTDAKQMPSSGAATGTPNTPAASSSTSSSSFRPQPLVGTKAYVHVLTVPSNKSVLDHNANIVSLLQTPAHHASTWNAGETLHHSEPKSGVTYLIHRLEARVWLVAIFSGAKHAKKNDNLIAEVNQFAAKIRNIPSASFAKTLRPKSAKLA